MRKGAKGLARLAVDRHDEGRRPVDPDVGQAGGGGVAEPQAHPRAGARLEPKRRGGAVGEHEAAAPAGRSRDRRVGEVVLDPALVVKAPVRQEDDDILVHVNVVGFVDHDRTEETAALLGGVGRAGVGEIEVETGIGRNEAEFGARARREPRPGEAAVARDRIGRAQAGK